MIRLSDVFEPTVYGSYQSVDNPMTSAFIRAGIMTNNAVMNGIARAGGRTAVVPFWRDIDPSIEPNYSNDDPADLAVPHKIGFGTMTARKSWVNQGFGEMDLVSELAGASPLQHVRNRFGTYWVRQLNRRLIATCVGVMARNIAANGGDMVVDISARVGALGVFDQNAFIDAAYTAGENADVFTGIAVHSMIMARMVKNDEVETQSEGGVVINRYKGRVIITDDTLPVEGTGDARVYTSILFGPGAIGFGGVDGSAFAYGEGIPKVAAEISRTPEAGNGGGMESIWERKTWIIHPHGFEWVEGGAVMAEMSPTLADLRLAAHYNRVVDRRQIPLAFIRSRAV